MTPIAERQTRTSPRSLAEEPTRMRGAAAGRVKVLVADDHPLFRGAITQVVKSRPELELVQAAGGGREALELIRSLQPDVAVLDVSMPDLDGIRVLAAVTREKLPTRVLFCATSTDSALVYDCVAAGAAGYLDKGASASEICEAILSVARGATVVSKRIETGVLQEIRTRREGPSFPLTPRELEVLGLLASGRSTRQIAAELYIEASTVKTHLAHLYEKLGVSDRAAAVAEGMRRGLVE